jgi:thiol-disulfide isomerase/thioredoxin
MMHAILLALLLAAQLVAEQKSSVSQLPENQSKVAPEFGLKDLRGRTKRLSDYKGKVVLINLWASWCAPCRVEMPELVRLQKTYQARGLQIIGVTYPDDAQSDIRRTARKFNLNYPVLFGTPELLEAYQIGEILPATVVVDRDGTIRDRILGILEPEEFTQKIAPLLDTPDKENLTVQSLKSPAAPGSGEPNLYTATDGRVFLTWIEPAESKGHRLRFSILQKRSWSEPRTIAEGSNWLVNWADFPSLIVLRGGALIGQWLVKAGPEGHAYDINVSRSTDGGKSWTSPVVPHRDGTKTEHGFVSMLPWTTGRASAVWLDGRNFKPASKDGHESSGNEMTLRFTAIDANGRLSEEALLDPRVCDCCQTSAALTAEGAIVVYRDRSDKEIRDISFVRFHRGRWTQPRSLSVDAWEIHGCPVNGPSVSADGRRVAVAWFTAAADRPAVKVVFSTDEGATFGQPIRVDEGNPVGRVDVLQLPDGSALVNWLERTATAGEVKVRRVRPDGSREQTITVAEPGVARASGFPQMARAGNEIIFAWTDPGTPSQVRTAVIRIDSVK